MEQTTKRGLNIWDEDDPVDVSQINANFEALDGPNAELITTKSVTSTTTSVTVSLASVDWSKYREVVLRCYLSGSGNCNVRTNSGTSQYDYCMALGASQTATSSLGYVYPDTYSSNCQAWIRLKCGYSASRCFSHHIEGTTSFFLGYNRNITFTTLTSMTITGDSATINSGSRIEVWGEF